MLNLPPTELTDLKQMNNYKDHKFQEPSKKKVIEPIVKIGLVIKEDIQVLKISMKYPWYSAPWNNVEIHICH